MNSRDALEYIASALEERGTDDSALLRSIYLVALGRKCVYCEAEPGDNEYCVMGGEPHPWVDVTDAT